MAQCGLRIEQSALNHYRRKTVIRDFSWSRTCGDRSSPCFGARRSVKPTTFYASCLVMPKVAPSPSRWQKNVTTPADVSPRTAGNRYLATKREHLCAAKRQDNSSAILINSRSLMRARAPRKLRGMTVGNFPSNNAAPRAFLGVSRWNARRLEMPASGRRSQIPTAG